MKISPIKTLFLLTETLKNAYFYLPSQIIKKLVFSNFPALQGCARFPKIKFLEKSESFLKIAIYQSLLLIACAFTSCATRPGKVVTMKSYLQVENGETREQILKDFGEPFSIELKEDGTEIFTYIERFFWKDEVIDSRFYYFYIKNGKVVGKVATSEPQTQSIDSDGIN